MRRSPRIKPLQLSRPDVIPLGTMDEQEIWKRIFKYIFYCFFIHGFFLIRRAFLNIILMDKEEQPCKNSQRFPDHLHTTGSAGGRRTSSHWSRWGQKISPDVLKVSLPSLSYIVNHPPFLSFGCLQPALIWQLPLIDWAASAEPGCQLKLQLPLQFQAASSPPCMFHHMMTLTPSVKL